MGLDIRWPIGLMFTAVGLLMAVYGLVTSSNAEMYKRSLGMNINVGWGIVLLIFGGLMLFFANRTKQQEKAAESKKTPVQTR